MAEKMPTNVPFRSRDYVTGRMRLPPEVAAMQDARFFIYGADTEGGAVTIASGASATLSIQIDDSAYFLVEAIHAKSSLQTVLQDGVMIQATDTTTARPWSDQPVPLRDFAGSGSIPKYLNDPQLLRPTTTINFQITNNTGSAATFYVVLIGRKLPSLTEAQATLMLRRSWFQYVVNFAGGITASKIGLHATTKIYNDSDFFVKKILSQDINNLVQAASGGALSQELMVMLRDTNGDKNYQNQKVPADLLFGALQSAYNNTANNWGGGDAMNLPKPILIRRNSVLDIEMDNRSTTAVATDIHVTLEGIRVFDAVA